MATAPATASPRSKKGILETCGDMMFHARWPLAKPVQNNKLPELYPAHSVCRRKKADTECAGTLEYGTLLSRNG